MKADDMAWRVLSSRQLFNDLWFKVRKERCETPLGKIVDPYYIYEFPEWVTCFALTQEGKVLMVRQYRHAIGRTCLEIPGGCIDPEDKTPQDAVARELMEETGYAFDNYHYLGKTCANPSTNNNWMHMFVATGGIQVAPQELDGNEEIEVVLLDMETFKTLFRNNEFIQSMHVTCMLYALLHLQQAHIS